MTTGGGIFSGGGGLLLLVGGLVVKHAEANEVSACSSGLGRFGQAFDPNLANSCASAQDLSSAANVAMWVGGVILVVAAVGVVVSLIGAGAVMASAKKAKTAGPPGSAGLGPGSSAPRPATGTAPARPAVTQVSGPPAQPPRLACGHEWRPDARFCPVCGRPVSDASSVTVAARPVPPVLPPPAVVPPPAMPDRWTGRSVDAPASAPYQASPRPAVKPGRHRVSR
jgi:hypothetical protein